MFGSFVKNANIPLASWLRNSLRYNEVALYVCIWATLKVFYHNRVPNRVVFTITKFTCYWKRRVFNYYFSWTTLCSIQYRYDVILQHTFFECETHLKRPFATYYLYCVTRCLIDFPDSIHATIDICLFMIYIHTRDLCIWRGNSFFNRSTAVRSVLHYNIIRTLCSPKALFPLQYRRTHFSNSNDSLNKSKNYTGILVYGHKNSELVIVHKI